MGNPFFNALGGGQLPGNLGNLAQLVQQFQQFKSTFQGNPKEQVQKMLQSGQISQQQLNQIQTIAQQFQTFLK